jgi:antitoxin component HigA of HigAB toxin-antitoxin module
MTGINTIIENEKQYNIAIQEIEKLMDIDSEPESAEGKRLQSLILLVKNYEKDLKILEFHNPLK